MTWFARVGWGFLACVMLDDTHTLCCCCLTWADNCILTGDIFVRWDNLDLNFWYQTFSDFKPNENLNEVKSCFSLLRTCHLKVLGSTIFFTGKVIWISINLVNKMYSCFGPSRIAFTYVHVEYFFFFLLNVKLSWVEWQKWRHIHHCHVTARNAHIIHDFMTCRTALILCRSFCMHV